MRRTITYAIVFLRRTRSKRMRVIFFQNRISVQIRNQRNYFWVGYCIFGSVRIEQAIAWGGSYILSGRFLAILVFFSFSPTPK